MKSKKFKILSLFDYNTFTGFATVSRNLVKHWKHTFKEQMQMDIVAVNYFGEEYSEDENIRVISAKLTDVAKDDFGRYVFMRSLKDIDYDLIFMFQDLGVIVPMIPHINKILEEKKAANRKQFKSVIYFPVDFDLTPNLAVGLEFFDTLATYTEYGRKCVLRLKPELQSKLKVIPHGNNMANFHELPKDQIANFRKEYFGENSEKFIVGCVNRNQSRKDIPTTIFGFMEYWSEYNPNSLLYLHMNPEDPMGWNLRTILSQTPLKEGRDYMFPPKDDYNKGADINKMNAIYNAMDVFLTTATGGGWELTLSEAMSVKTPTICPKHTSFTILGGDEGERAYFLNTLYPIVAMVDNVIRFQSDLYEIADTLDLVHKHIISQDPILKEKLQKAYTFVESLNWKTISKSFSDEFKRLV